MKIKDRYKEDRPREKLAKSGAGRLSDLELLMAIIGSGNAQADVGTIARQVLKLLQDKHTLETEVQRTQKEIEQIKSYLDSLKNDGRVSASGDVYAGVKIVIRDSIEEVRSDCKAVTFYLDNGFVRYGKYQDDDQEDAKKVPSGYSAD